MRHSDHAVNPTGHRISKYDSNVKTVWGMVIGSAVVAALVVRWLRMPKPKVFDTASRTDLNGKMRMEPIFAHLNRSGRPGSAASRALIETLLSRVPQAEQADFCSRFRCDDDVQFAAAFQELTLHELLWRQGCKLRFHPNVPGTTKQPDFHVRQSRAPEFLLEACTSMAISSGPESSPRGDRIRDFLERLNLNGYLIGIDELTAGSEDLRQDLLARHIDDGIKAAVVGYAAESISIPLLTTTDGWRIKLTAFPTARYGARSGTVMQEAWTTTWNGPSYPLRDSLKKKSGRYGNQLAMPYVIAVNSLDAMLTDRDLEETLFGARPQTAVTDNRLARGFWGTATAPNHRRVSAVLFTKNLWPATLLTGAACAYLYLNPWAYRPYDGVLTALPTFRFESDVPRPGARLHKLLKLRLRNSTLWE